MKLLRELQDKQYELLFKKGKPLEKLFPLYEANDTFLYTPGEVTKGASHVRDGLDLKRMMVTVVTALGLCMLMAMYNTGYQAFRAIEGGAEPLDIGKRRGDGRGPGCQQPVGAAQQRVLFVDDGR